MIQKQHITRIPRNLERNLKWLNVILNINQTKLRTRVKLKWKMLFLMVEKPEVNLDIFKRMKTRIELNFLSVPELTQNYISVLKLNHKSAFIFQKFNK